MMTEFQQRPFTTEEEELMKNLLTFQEMYEYPSEEDFNNVTPFSSGDSLEDGMKRFIHLTEMTLLTVRLIAEFSKRVPGFDTLCLDDQKTLLKERFHELMMLRAARKYNNTTKTILLANNQPYTIKNFHSAWMGEFGDAIFNFSRYMWTMKVNDSEYALLTAIIIFSATPNLLEPKQVERLRQYYIGFIKSYLTINRVGEILLIENQLKDLSMNFKRWFLLKVHHEIFPPSLQKKWKSLYAAV